MTTTTDDGLWTEDDGDGDVCALCGDSDHPEWLDDELWGLSCYTFGHTGQRKMTFRTCEEAEEAATWSAEKFGGVASAYQCDRAPVCDAEYMEGCGREFKDVPPHFHITTMY